MLHVERQTQNVTTATDVIDTTRTMANDTPKQQQSPAAKPKGKTPKHKVNDNRFSLTFADVMNNVDPSGQYAQTHKIELKQKINLGRATVAERNFLKNQAMALMRYGGLSPMEVSYLLSLPLSTVTTWRSKATPEMLAEIKAAELSLVANRVAQAVNTSLGAIERVAIYVSERDYIQRNTPESVVRILERLEAFTTKLVEAKQRMDVAKRQADVDANVIDTPHRLQAVPDSITDRTVLDFAQPVNDADLVHAVA